ncbi:endonuclease-reverse transcriptase [Plakobranchus ocellatus]|uniref:Endonuclease-reverse transcriptase n=1 Tax=Plakobranchus ocellatus TaxID=259542 RepID=A0AAV4DY03_9GAST|nr:endonuclease-reverse transcriptase [Plakobranchus ocellatus]
MKTNQESRLVLKKNFSTTDHLQASNQLIEKCNEYNLLLCLGFIDYEKAFDSVEHAAIVQALKKVNINENYVTMIETIYKERIHMDNQISEALEIQRGVRQGDPISPKLFITIIEQVFKEADLKYGISIDGEYLRDLRSADNVALCTEKEEETEENLERLSSENKKVGLKIHKGKTKYMTNYITERPIVIDNENIELITKYTYLSQTTTMKNRANEEIITRIR